MSKIYLLGLPASGKSTLGRELAAKLQMPFIDLDQEIEKRYRKSIADIFESKGEGAFRAMEQLTLFEIQIKFKTFVMALGGGTPCNNENLASIASGETIYLSVPTTEIVKRLKSLGKNIRPLLTDQSDLLAVLNNLLQRREKYYLQAKYVIKGRDIKLNDLLKCLRN